MEEAGEGRKEDDKVEKDDREEKDEKDEEDEEEDEEAEEEGSSTSYLSDWPIPCHPHVGW